jgi:hypothetical protein
MVVQPVSPQVRASWTWSGRTGASGAEPGLGVDAAVMGLHGCLLDRVSSVVSGAGTQGLARAGPALTTESP